MDKTKIEDKVEELVKEFGWKADSKEDRLAIMAKQASDSKKLRKSSDRLHESLDYLRICIKYQNFDLEATRRENKSLRKILEEKDRS